MASTYKINQQNTVLPNNLSNYTINWSNTSIGNNGVLTVPAGTDNLILNETATFEVKGKVVINGQNLEERLKNIEEVLQIPERDVILEQKYPKLKTMYDEYMKTLKNYRNWETLKGTDND